MTMTIDGTNGITFPDSSQQYNSYYGFKNRLINGAFVFDQRNAGASVTGTAGGLYSLDRWNIFRTSSATGYTAQQQTSGTGNFTNAIRVQRTNGNTSTEGIYLTQVVESYNCNNLSGLSVTLSFYARAGANYSATSSILSTRIVTGTTADQGIAGVYAGTWAGYTSTDQNNTLTTSFQKFTQTVTLGSGVKELAVWFKETPVGTAGANDWFEITGAQIEVGSIATSFDYRPYTTELQLCQRYFEMSYPQGIAPGTASQQTTALAVYNNSSIATTAATLTLPIRFKVSKRISPSVTIYQPITGTTGQMRNYDTGASITSVVFLPSQEQCSLNTQDGTNGCSSNQPLVGHFSASAEL